VPSNGAGAVEGLEPPTNDLQNHIRNRARCLCRGHISPTPENRPLRFASATVAFKRPPPFLISEHDDPALNVVIIVTTLDTNGPQRLAGS